MKRGFVGEEVAPIIINKPTSTSTSTSIPTSVNPPSPPTDVVISSDNSAATLPTPSTPQAAPPLPLVTNAKEGYISLLQKINMGVECKQRYFVLRGASTSISFCFEINFFRCFSFFFSNLHTYYNFFFLLCKKK